jgi:hypothetical protein
MSTLQVSTPEIAFKKLAESVRTALQTFNALRAIPTNGTVSSPLRAALNDLVTATVGDLCLLISCPLTLVYF